MSGYNPNFQGQPGPYGSTAPNHLNMRPRPSLQRTNSGASSLANISPFPQGATQVQGGVGFNSTQQQQLDYRPQQMQGMYPGQQQQQQQQLQGNFGPLGQNGAYQTTQGYGHPGQSQPMMGMSSQPQQHAAAMARLHQQQQQQYLQSARQVHTQAQATQPMQQQQPPRMNGAPHPGHGQITMPQQRQAIPSNHQPMPMQRTFSNQSNTGGGGGGGPGQVGVTRPHLPISGYQPQLGPSGSGSASGSFGIAGPAPAQATSADTSRRDSNPGPLPYPLPLTQVSDPAALRAAALPSIDPEHPTASGPGTGSGSGQGSGPGSGSSVPAPSKSTMTSTAPTEAPPKKRRRKDGDAPAKPRKKAEEKPAPVVYFNGVEKVREDPSAGEKKGERRNSGGNGTPAGSALPQSAATAAAAAPAAERRRGGNGEGLRGSMTNELSNLMYVAGDVRNPSRQSVDYVEDLVVEFLSDLCRPTPPVRAFPGAPYFAPPLTDALVRHRLTRSHRPHMAKYLARFDYMLVMAAEVAAHSRVEQDSVENVMDTMDIKKLENEGKRLEAAAAGRKGPGGPPGKRGRPRKAEGGPGQERRKPGPKKGWKKEIMGSQAEGKKRGPYKKKAKDPAAAGVKVQGA